MCKEIRRCFQWYFLECCLSQQLGVIQYSVLALQFKFALKIFYDCETNNRKRKIFNNCVLN